MSTTLNVMSRAYVFASILAICGCGAKTGLLVPDSGPDGGMDAGIDAGVDAAVCMPEPVALQRRGAQLMFVVDRSNSMARTLDDEVPGPGEDDRWQVLRDALASTLGRADPLLEVGAEFYPSTSAEGARTPQEACMIDTGIDLVPVRNNTPNLLSVFDSTNPAGGTPTALALDEVAEFFERRPAPGIPRFVVLATDGGPNCNPDTGIPPSVCICTGRDACGDPEFGPFNCLDEVRTLDAMERVAVDVGVPVYVIGIDDPTRPDLADYLDQLADAGGRPRSTDPDERQFYSVRREEDLRGALDEITGSIAQCVFTLEPVPGEAESLVVRVDDLRIARDGTRMEGWDFTAPDRSELTLFGGACARVTEGGGEVTAEIACEEE